MTRDWLVEDEGGGEDSLDKTSELLKVSEIGEEDNW